MHKHFCNNKIQNDVFFIQGVLEYNMTIYYWVIYLNLNRKSMCVNPCPKLNYFRCETFHKY